MKSKKSNVRVPSLSQNHSSSILIQKRKNILNIPKLIGYFRCHRRSNSQGLMNPAEIRKERDGKERDVVEN